MARQTRKSYTYPGRRIPAIILYEEHIAAITIIEKYWKGIMGRKYAFADVQRQLLLQEAQRIQKKEEEEAIIAR